MGKKMWVKGIGPDGNEFTVEVNDELREKIQEDMMPPALSIMENNESVSLVDMGLYEYDILPLKMHRIVELEFDDE